MQNIKEKKRTKEEIDKWRITYKKFLKEHGSPMLGKKRSKVFCDKMSIIAKNRKPSEYASKLKAMWKARKGSKATEQQKENYSNARLKYMEENSDKIAIKLFNTKPELDFEKILIDENIPYRKQIKIGKYLYDFILYDNIIIEIDGPYHYNHNLYGDRFTSDDIKFQKLKLTQEKDKNKTQTAIDNNYIIYRIKVSNFLPSDFKLQLYEQGCKIFKI